MRQIRTAIYDDVSVESALSSVFEKEIKISHIDRIAGGDINEARRLTVTGGSHIFMKANTAENIPFFIAEAAGLSAIAAAGAIGTPRVLCCGTDKSKGGYSYLLLEFISGQRRVSGYWEIFARELAAMHRAETANLVSGGKYGFFCDNYIGSRQQANTAGQNWIDFFRDCRLAPQIEAAACYFSPAERKKAVRLLDHLEDFLVEPDHPSLLHGDLWFGNVITGNDGKAWLIDPAAYAGHAEADLAMTELFGGFPQEFYDAYRETAPFQPGYQYRRDLYNLYHLLNHLNIFGRSYLSSVMHILEKYSS